jgi:uncharacterized membrane protein
VTPRRGYLDWLRGVAVLIMIGSHTLDSWTRVADRVRPEYSWAMVVSGFGAPVFLFLAGIILVLAAASRVQKGLSAPEAAARARPRAWHIHGLAFVFRLQSWVISGGGFPRALLKVDILNVMGIAMLGAAILWGLGRGRVSRTVLLAGSAVAAAMLTPLIRATPLLAVLPDPVEWYLRPSPGRTNFTLFPWSGFLLAGAATGVWLEAARQTGGERRINIALAVVGPAVAVAGYAASFLPPIYAETSFWTSSPTFFFVRLGILMAAVPVGYAWNTVWRGRSRLREFGIASLFVYWIHVEMVYGVISIPLHRRLSFEQALVAFAAFSVFLFGLVKLRDRVIGCAPSPVTSEPVGSDDQMSLSVQRSTHLIKKDDQVRHR